MFGLIHVSWVSSGEGKFSKIANYCPILLKFCTQVCELQAKQSETWRLFPWQQVYNGNFHQKRLMSNNFVKHEYIVSKFTQ